MRRILLIITAAVLMATLVAVLSAPGVAQVEPNSGRDNARQGQSKSQAPEQTAQTPAADNYQTAQQEPATNVAPAAEENAAAPAEYDWTGSWWDAWC